MGTLTGIKGVVIHLLVVLSAFVLMAAAYGKGGITSRPNPIAVIPGLTGQDADFTCHMAIVQWRDAVIYTRKDGLDVTKLDELTADTLSFGCIVESDKTIGIIHSFVEGKPADFLVIPKSWATKIVPLAPQAEEPTKP